jgi:hypothetical protein
MTGCRHRQPAASASKSVSQWRAQPGTPGAVLEPEIRDHVEDQERRPRSCPALNRRATRCAHGACGDSGSEFTRMPSAAFLLGVPLPDDEFPATEEYARTSDTGGTMERSTRGAESGQAAESERGIEGRHCTAEADHKQVTSWFGQFKKHATPSARASWPGRSARRCGCIRRSRKRFSTRRSRRHARRGQAS